MNFFFFSSRRRHTRFDCDWSSDVCSSDLVRGRAYTVFAYESRAFRARLAELLARESFDLVHMDSLDLSGYLPALEGLPIVCVHHNIEATLLRRRAGLERRRWRAGDIRPPSRVGIGRAAGRGKVLEPG